MKLRDQLLSVIDSIVPRPKSVELGSGVFTLAQGVALQAEGGEEATALAELFQSRWQKAFGLKLEIEAKPARGIRVIRFELTGKRLDRAIPTRCTEGYQIEIAKTGVTLRGQTRAGLYYAALTFQQLVLAQESAWIAPVLRLTDWPEFGYRGLLVAPGQGFMPWAECKRTIELAAHSKLNVIHFHMTDNNIFVPQLDTYPDLGGKGVIPNEAERGSYSKKDLKRIIAYASEHNIQIMPAIDFPGHAMAVLREFPELRCKPVKGEVSEHTMCIGTEATYEFLDNVIGELAPLFPSPYFHIGTDEIEFLDVPQFGVFHSWNECAACQKRMKDEKLKDIRALFYYFVRRVRESFKQRGKITMMWNDQIDSGKPKEVDVPRDVAMHFWRIAAPGRGPHENCSYQSLVKLGFPIVNSFFPETYIDLYIKQDRLAVWNPLNAPPLPEPEKYREQVLGSTFCAWEHIDIYSRVLPSAIPFFADRVWNLNPVEDQQAFGERVAKHILGNQIPQGLEKLFEALGGVILPQNDKRTQLAHLERAFLGQTEAERLESARAMLALIKQAIKSKRTRDMESLREYAKCVGWVVDELAKRVQGIGI